MISWFSHSFRHQLCAIVLSVLYMTLYVVAIFCLGMREAEDPGGNDCISLHSHHTAVDDSEGAPPADHIPDICDLPPKH